jgi:hypothetical protein
MRELVPLTDAAAARIIASAMSGRGGDHAIVAGGQALVSTTADAAAGLTVKSRELKSGYTRDQLDQSRGDIERNGGDTRIICTRSRSAS